MRLFEDAEFYHENSQVQSSEAVGLLKSLDIDLADKSLLDIGCGDGKVTRFMSRLGAKVTGVDSSQSMIQFCKSSDSLVDFINIDAKDVDTLPNSYSIVTSFNCLHWISEIEDVLANIRKKLEKSGTFIGLIYPRCDALWKAAELLETVEPYSTQRKGFVNPYQYHTVSGFRALLQQAGFSDADVWQKSRSSEFESAHSFKGYIRGWLPHCRHFSDSFIDDWFDNYAELTEQCKEGAIAMEYQAIYFQAKS
ncbi:class I SAM-dependent methyltransferase [Vibrio sp. S4M6]|uniref:class I SAM-dependent methyltransferase n=1 Tax=Vibrio sinus TaxID=2946865 RepID=UPI002029E027|nr:class I SAM-dependent methyltransferase [Vibrio sinus]MCL9782491.1 class I SAM-dependent methyltransferase [Vibrio sinus]